MDYQIDCEIKEKLKTLLTPQRYEHTLGVANTCVCLAMSRGLELEDAYIAGLLHDCAKCIPDEEKIARCEMYGIEISNIERKSPYLLHAKLGAYEAEHQFGVTKRNILNAICCHTTGKPKMNDLEMILFVADYIEPGRTKAHRLKKIRMTAFHELEDAVYMILKDTLNYLKRTGKPMDKMTEKSYEYYRKFYEE